MIAKLVLPDNEPDQQPLAGSAAAILFVVGVVVAAASFNSKSVFASQQS
jgi:hypothetical protein